MGSREHRNRYSLSEPYPEIRVANRNLFYAKLLLDDFASSGSELNAILQYLYHHFRFAHGNLKDIADLTEGIAIVEMHHMEMLGELILKLGGNPCYHSFQNDNGQYYSGTYVYYGQSVMDMLSADIESERGAIEQYRKHVEQIQDPYVQAVLKRIIKDEEYHLSLFKEAYQRYQGMKKD